MPLPYNLCWKPFHSSLFHCSRRDVRDVDRILQMRINFVYDCEFRVVLWRSFESVVCKKWRFGFAHRVHFILNFVPCLMFQMLDCDV